MHEGVLAWRAHRVGQLNNDPSKRSPFEGHVKAVCRLCLGGLLLRHGHSGAASTVRPHRPKDTLR